VAIGHIPQITAPRKNAMPSHIDLINLDRSVARLTSFRKNNPHLAIERFSAIDGAAVDRQRLVAEGILAEDLAYLPGSLGCALSHISLWKKAVSENKVVTVMEDDVACSFAFEEEARRVLSQLPDDWDLIKWGANFYPNFLWMDFGFSKAKLEFYDRRYLTDQIAFQRKRFAPSAIRIAHSFGLQAYSVSPKGARALIDHCLPLHRRLIPFPSTNVVIEDIGIDSAMCGAYASMQAFLCIPPLAIPDQDQVSDRDGIDKQHTAGNSPSQRAGLPRN
jgi:GR25 family glycosyltransferase involved in LPS biosynthesis